MPWCDDCSKFWEPAEPATAQQCPSCGKVVVTARRGTPWHFKLLLVAFAGYMVYRIYWFVEWLPKHV